MDMHCGSDMGREIIHVNVGYRRQVRALTLSYFSDHYREQTIFRP